METYILQLQEFVLYHLEFEKQLKLKNRKSKEFSIAFLTITVKNKSQRQIPKEFTSFNL